MATVKMKLSGRSGFLTAAIFLLPWLSHGALIVGLSPQRDSVGQYEKFEVAVLSSLTYHNPFNPEEVDMWGEFVSPSAVHWRVNGFWDGQGWRVRFAPDETGQWTYQVNMRDSTSTATTQGSFTVTASFHHGWLRVSDKDSRYLEFDDGSPFYGVGFCRAWWLEEVPTLLDDMRSAACNVLVYWMPWWDNMLVNDSTGYDRYDMDRARNIDRLVDACEDREIRIVLTIWDHEELRDEAHPVIGAGFSKNNPFRFLSSATGFFSNTESWKYQTYLYRYIIARWGYSRAIGSWHTVSEIQITNSIFDPLSKQNTPANWHSHINAFFTGNDPFGRPTTASWWARDWEDGLATTGMHQPHLYPSTSPVGVPGVVAPICDELFTRFARPNFIGELGTPFENQQLGFLHYSVWAGLMAGSAMTPMKWNDGGFYGDMTPEMFEQLHNFRRFVDTVNLPESGLQTTVTTTAPLSLASTLPSGNILGLRGESLAMWWLLDTAQSPSVTSATVELRGLAPGEYETTFYAPWEGEWRGSTRMIASRGRIEVTCPTFSKDLAAVVRHLDRGLWQTQVLNDFTTGTENWLVASADGGASASLTFDNSRRSPASIGGSLAATISLPVSNWSSVRIAREFDTPADLSNLTAFEFRVFLPEGAPRGIVAQMISRSSASSAWSAANYNQTLMAGKWNLVRGYREDIADPADVTALGIRILGNVGYRGAINIDAVRGVLPRVGAIPNVIMVR